MFLILISWYIHFCSVTKNYFENLVRALENGLADVDGNGATFSRATSSKNAAGSSKGRAGRGKAALRTSRTSDDSHWSCDHCSSMNIKSATTCQICNQRRWKFWFPFRNTCCAMATALRLMRGYYTFVIIWWLQYVKRMKGLRHGIKIAILALAEFECVLFCRFLLQAFVTECCNIVDAGDEHKYIGCLRRCLFRFVCWKLIWES